MFTLHASLFLNMYFGFYAYKICFTEAKARHDGNEHLPYSAEYDNLYEYESDNLCS